MRGRIVPLSAFGSGGFKSIGGLAESIARPVSPIANKLAVSSTSSQTEVTVRKLFRESWLWSDVFTSG